MPAGPCGRHCVAPSPKSLGKSASSQFSGALDACRAGSCGGRATVDRYEQIDVRLLRRRGLLQAGAQFKLGSIRGRNAGTHLLLSWGKTKQEPAQRWVAGERGLQEQNWQ